MLTIDATLKGDRIILNGLQGLSRQMPTVIRRGLARVAKGTHREAHDWLSGPGRTPMRHSGRATPLRGQSDSLGAAPGSYPVPVMTGHLRRMLDWVGPGRSKTSGGLTFSAGPLGVVIYDSAEYAATIHEGRGSSAKYGPRRFLIDGFRRFNEGDRTVEILKEEIAGQMKKEGL